MKYVQKELSIGICVENQLAASPALVLPLCQCHVHSEGQTSMLTLWTGRQSRKRKERLHIFINKTK